MGKCYSLAFFLWMLTISTVRAQSFSLTGKVIDSLTHSPLAGANIYLSNTSISTSSDKNGDFKLTNIPVGTYQIVASHIGYHNSMKTVSLTSNKYLDVPLTPKDETMEEVIITNTKVKKRLRNEWLRIFFKQVVGSSPFANFCTIENKEALRFKYDKNNHTLTAFSSEPLLITNRALGYHIKYDLQNFAYNELADIMSYTGIPVYSNMQGSAEQIQQWTKNRKETYDISLLKFMRAMYRQEGDSSYILFRPLSNTMPITTNDDYKKIASANEYRYPENAKRLRTTNMVNGAHRTVVTDGVFFINVAHPPIPIKDICYRADSATVVLNFKGKILAEIWENNYNYSRRKNNYLLVNEGLRILESELSPNYRWESIKIVNPLGGRLAAGLFPTAFSEFILATPESIAISANGYYTNGNHLLLSGIFAWVEKLGTMLPLDYYPD